MPEISEMLFEESDSEKSGQNLTFLDIDFRKNQFNYILMAYIRLFLRWSWDA